MTVLDIFDTSGTQNTNATHGAITMHGFGHNRSDFARYSPLDIASNNVCDVWLTGTPTALQDRFDDPRYYKGGMLASADSIKTGMVAYWGLEEDGTSNRVDSHDGLDMTIVATAPGRDTGADGVNYAVELTRGSNDTLIHSLSANDLSPGNSDFTFACWVKFKTGSLTSFQSIAGIWLPAGDQREWLLQMNTVGQKLEFNVTSDGTFAGLGRAQHPTSPLVETWYFVVGAYDSVNDLVKISVTKAGDPIGGYTTAAHSGGVFEGTGDFTMGSNGNIDVTFAVDGYVDEAAYWSRLITDDEKEFLYNSGTALTYGDL